MLIINKLKLCSKTSAPEQRKKGGWLSRKWLNSFGTNSPGLGALFSTETLVMRFSQD